MDQIKLLTMTLLGLYSSLMFLQTKWT